MMRLATTVNVAPIAPASVRSTNTRRARTLVVRAEEPKSVDAPVEAAQTPMAADAGAPTAPAMPKTSTPVAMSLNGAHC